VVLSFAMTDIFGQWRVTVYVYVGEGAARYGTGYVRYQYRRTYIPGHVPEPYIGTCIPYADTVVRLLLLGVLAGKGGRASSGTEIGNSWNSTHNTR